VSAHRVECGKCDGAGRIGAFAHVLRGVCFACEGRGHFTYTDDEYADHLDRLAAARRCSEARIAELDEAQRIERADRLARFAADHPTHAEALRIAVDAGLGRAWELLAHVADTYAADRVGSETGDVLPMVEALPAYAFSADDVDLATILRDTLR
jgi:hypothetical protein